MKPAYLLEGVVVCYDSREVLRMDRLEIDSQGIFAVVGANGAGKSTLLTLLAFLLSPSKGRFRFFGQPASGRSIGRFRRQVGWAPQNPYLLRGTVLDNVALPLKLRGVPAGERLRCASAVLEKVGLDRLSAQSVGALSGGEMQKVALARSLVTGPRVLICDEPFTYLDGPSAAVVENLLAGYAHEQGRTVIFTSHDRLQAWAVADRVIGLVEGRLAPAPMTNCYRGKVCEGYFDTGQIRVLLPDPDLAGGHLCIDPEEIVLSREPLKSSMRNTFDGRVVAVAEVGGQALVTLAGKERFQALVSRQAAQELEIGLGTRRWVNFKSAAVRVF